MAGSGFFDIEGIFEPGAGADAPPSFGACPAQRSRAGHANEDAAEDVAPWLDRGSSLGRRGRSGPSERASAGSSLARAVGSARAAMASPLWRRAHRAVATRLCSRSLLVSRSTWVNTPMRRSTAPLSAGNAGGASPPSCGCALRLADVGADGTGGRRVGCPSAPTPTRRVVVSWRRHSMIHKEDRTFGSVFGLDSAPRYPLRLSIRLVRAAFNAVRRTGARMLVRRPGPHGTWGRYGGIFTSTGVALHAAGPSKQVPSPTPGMCPSDAS